ncbi:MAG: amidohydrolase family protein, partial [Vicinamibacterales bacterium]
MADTIPADFLIDNADLVYACEGPFPRAGAAQRDLAPIPRGSVAARDGRIVFVGPAAACRAAVRLAGDAVVVDGRGRTVVPGFVDPHTHLVFAGDRRDELRRRLAGASYAEIAAAGGGIVRTVAATRAASEEDLVAAALPRLAAMLAAGTTTAEVKSGYGLDLASELAMLRAARTLGERQPVDIVPTFLGALEIPLEYRDRRADYVRLVVDGMIPAVAAEGL